MRIRKTTTRTMAVIGICSLSAPLAGPWGVGLAGAAEIPAVDLASLDLGPKVDGPLGPEVEVTLVNASGQGVGDLESSVSCPAGFTSCSPPNENPPGTIYTYVHRVTPGVDLPNDPPFPSPDEIIDLDDVTGFSLGFAASGFTGVAGFDFTEASSAVTDASAITIEELADGSIAWSVANDEWDSGEPITFFWQTTQRPIGPAGLYNVQNSVTSGSGRGPLPLAIPEPTAVVFWLGAGLFAAQSRNRC